MGSKLLIVICLVTVTVLPGGLTLSAERPETRVMLDEDFLWLTPVSADRLLERIKAAGFNVFMPCVWHGRGVTWPSKLAPKEPKWVMVSSISNKDPFGHLVKKAHQMGIEVHPWFTIALRQRDFFSSFYDNGTPEKSFNIHIPGFRKYITDLVIEVVKRYDVDGINLDYVRSLGFCRSNYCIDDYRAKYGRNLLEDLAFIRLSNDARSALIDWNSKAVGDIVENISREVKRIKPNIIISVDSLAGDKAWREQGADSVQWANRDWVDVVFHMHYQDGIDTSRFVHIADSFKDPDKFLFLLGNYYKGGSRDATQLLELISNARNFRPNGNGIALYEVRFLNDAQIKALRSGPFQNFTKTDWKKKRESPQGNEKGNYQTNP